MCCWIRRWGKEERKLSLGRRKPSGGKGVSSLQRWWHFSMLRHPGSDLNRVSFLYHMALDLSPKQSLLKGPLQVPGDPCFHWRDHISLTWLTKMESFWAHIHELIPVGWGDLSGGWTTKHSLQREGRARTDTWDRTWVCVCGDRDNTRQKREMSSLGTRLFQTIQQNYCPSVELRKKAHEMGSDTGWALKMQQSLEKSGVEDPRTFWEYSL